MSQTSSGLPLIDRAQGHRDNTAIIDRHGSYTYKDLLNASAHVAAALLDGRDDLADARVCYLIDPSLEYVSVQWGIWRAGGVAVPMCVHHPAPELAYVIDDSECEIVVADATYADRLEPLARERNLRFLRTEDFVKTDAPDDVALPALSPERPAMLIYTSGTTSKPKGVVLTHANLEAQITSLVEAWGWEPDDHILELLPLHHLHGILNVVSCALWSGATCEMLPQFDADVVWDRIAAKNGLTLFMAVPTIYARLVHAWKAGDAETRAARSAGCEGLRVMISGSAALPVPTLEEWRTISGHTLLERYGMTEIGMGISNPLNGQRRPGHVGQPLPGVSVRLVDEKFNDVPEGTSGQILIKGANVFGQYWRKPDATEAAFTDDGWFKTGDVAVLDDGYYRILGRSSVDIIKTGGYKVSALEIEAALQSHEAIDQCAVVGVADPEWGERVAAAVVLAEGHDLTLKSLRDWGKERLAVYKVPSLLLIVDELPRNPMGKVTKPAVTDLFLAEQTAQEPKVATPPVSQSNKVYRILIGKPGLDGHDRGAKYIAHVLRDAGFEIIYTGLRRKAEDIVATAVQEDVNAIGLSILSGAHIAVFERVIALLAENHAQDIILFAGGIIPPEDAAQLKAMGVSEVFTPGTTDASIVEAIRTRLNARAEAK